MSGMTAPLAVVSMAAADSAAAGCVAVAAGVCARLAVQQRNRPMKGTIAEFAFIVDGGSEGWWDGDRRRAQIPVGWLLASAMPDVLLYSLKFISIGA